MLLDAIGLALALLGGQPAALLAPDVTFKPRERAVSDWRWQAAANLDASPGTRAGLLLGPDPAGVTRCVRLNNYWCIKRGGWSGEIAADAEGHVAFASAAEGATVAALLLRRYYVDYGRHSALAIVSRWAPASCGAPAAPGRGRPDGLAARGLGGTLRARWLAAHGRRVAGRGRGRPRVSVVPDRLIGTALPVPTIALGLGAAPVGLSARLPEGLAARASPERAGPAPACEGDRLRIAHYAARAAAGIAASPTADLGLFDAAGRPTPNLARLMRNMAAVEIGPLGAGKALVETAVAHAAEVVAARNPGVAGAGGIDQGPR
jgi:hypothetical protein